MIWQLSPLPMIEVRHLYFWYDPGTEILKDVSCAIFEGEMVGLIGQNGSGKTTLVKQFNGLLKPKAGICRVDGEDTFKQTLAAIAKTVGFVFQNPDHQIFCPTVREELAFGPKNLGHNDDTVQELVAEALARFKIEKYADYPPAILGFGIRRKVSLAAVYAMKPKVMIMDEPTTGLDRKSALELMEIALELNNAGHTVVLITHDMRVIAEYTKRSIVLRAGRIVADGPTRDVLADFDMLKKTQIMPSDIVRLSAGLVGKGLSNYVYSNEEFMSSYSGDANHGF